MSALRKLLLAVWLALFSPVLLAVSDLALSSLAQKGLHEEMIRALEPHLAAGGDLSSFQFMLLGYAYYEVGKYRAALATADRMEQRVKAGDGTIFGADLSVYPDIIRAAVLLDQGQYDAARSRAAAALAQLKQNQSFYRQQVIQASGILGVAAALAGDKDEARRNLARIEAVGLALSNLGPEKYAALARIHMALDEYGLALQSIDDPGANVDALLAAFYDPTFQNLPKFFMRCKGLLETGRIDQARQGYDELLRHPQIVQFGAMYWVALYDRARIALQDGDPARAIDLLQKAIEVIEEQRASIDTEAGRIGFVGDKQAVYGRLVALLLQRGQSAAAFDAVERAKSRALVDMLAGRQDLAVAETAGEEGRRALAELDALDRSAGERGAPDAVQAARRGLRAARQRMAAAAPELAALVSVGSVAADDVKALLAPDEALVEYYRQGGDLYAFVMRRQSLAAFKLDGEGLDGQVAALREAIEAAGGDDWRPLAEGLHRRLWQPIEGALGGAGSVTVVAHGPLHYLPFAVLRAPDGRLLIDRWGLRFLPSASVLKFLRPPRTAPAASLLAFGNPDLGDPKLDLQFAEGEARAVAALFPDARLLLRRDASKANLKKAGAAFRRLHFATHGQFRADAPLSSGLLLAADSGGDSVLSVAELYSMRLDADLVTLSACETGLGKVASGDDIVGLTRGFLYAGARAIVASLWSVDDRATARLMQAFYRNLGRQDAREALRQAQLATRQAFPHPFFWAAFQLTGRPD